MKIYELIAELAKRPAGDDVCVSHNGKSYSVYAATTREDEGLFIVVGEGNYCVTEEDETGEPTIDTSAKKKK